MKKETQNLFRREKRVSSSVDKGKKSLAHTVYKMTFPLKFTLKKKDEQNRKHKNKSMNARNKAMTNLPLKLSVHTRPALCRLTNSERHEPSNKETKKYTKTKEGKIQKPFQKTTLKKTARVGFLYNSVASFSFVFHCVYRKHGIKEL